MAEAAEEELVKEANAAAVVLEVAATSPLVRDFDRHEAARRADLFRRLVAALSRAEAESLEKAAKVADAMHEFAVGAGYTQSWKDCAKEIARQIRADAAGLSRTIDEESRP